MNLRYYNVGFGLAVLMYMFMATHGYCQVSGGSVNIKAEKPTPDPAKVEKPVDFSITATPIEPDYDKKEIKVSKTTWKWEVVETKSTDGNGDDNDDPAKGTFQPTDNAITKFTVTFDHPGKKKIKVRATATFTFAWVGDAHGDLPPPKDVKKEEELKVEIPIEITTDKKSYKRDEIFDVTLHIPKSSKEQKFQIKMLDGKPTLNLGPRKDVLAYDFGDGTTSFTQTDGGKARDKFLVKIPAQTPKMTIKAVVNQEQEGVTFEIMADAKNDIKAHTEKLDIKKQIRKYAEKEGGGNTNAKVNAYDNLFEGATALWQDWGYSSEAAGKPFYTFLSPASRYEPELLKAICYKESSMNGDEANKHGTSAEDIMQVNAGNSGVLNNINGSGVVQMDWNARAVPIPPVVDKAGIKHANLFLIDELTTEPVPPNTASVTMHYFVHAPGPAKIVSQADSVRWAVRELLYKQTSSTFVRIILKGGKEVHYRTSPKARSISDAVTRYGTGKATYASSVMSCQNYGYGAQGKNDFVWPILINMKARH